MSLHSPGFEVVKTRGSHAKLCRAASGRGRRILTVPIHKKLAMGILRAIHRQALRSVPESALPPCYSDDD